MEIRKLGESVSINSDHANILIFPDKKSETLGDWNVVLGGSFGVMGIVSPGEYESHEIWVMAFNTDPGEKVNNVYLAVVDGVRIAVMESNVAKLTAAQISKLGIVDVIVVNKSAELKNLEENVSQIEPQMIIPVGYTA